MSEYSRPWPGTSVGTDTGPYSSNNWNDVWGAMARSSVDFGISANYNIGVFYAVGNALEPTVNGANIDVDTGASLVDGLYHENDATVSISIPTPSASTRVDYIVVRKNYQTGVTYTPALAGPTVTQRTARITVIRGTEGAGTPSLTQDTTRTTYWDIPLATASVTTGGAITMTDMREFIDAETKQFFVQVICARNVDTSSTIDINSLNQNFPLPASGESIARSRTICPSDYISNFTVTSVVSPSTTAANDIYTRTELNYGACGESNSNHTDDSGYAADTIVTAGNYYCVREAIASSISPGDIVSIVYRRDGDNILDTYIHDLYVSGFKVEYFGWKK